MADFDFFTVAGDFDVDFDFDFVGAGDFDFFVFVGAGGVVGVALDDGGLVPLDGTVEVVRRADVVALGVLTGTGRVGEVADTDEDVGLDVDVGVGVDVDVDRGRGVAVGVEGCCVGPLGAGAWNRSWAGCCSRCGSTPAPAATASPVTAANRATVAMPTRAVNRVAPRSAGAG